MKKSILRYVIPLFLFLLIALILTVVAYVVGFIIAWILIVNVDKRMNRTSTFWKKLGSSAFSWIYIVMYYIQRKRAQIRPEG